jgi:hypothetical protein
VLVGVRVLAGLGGAAKGGTATAGGPDGRRGRLADRDRRAPPPGTPGRRLLATGRPHRTDHIHDRGGRPLMLVELLLVDDCPHADAARGALQRGLNQLGLDVTVEERLGDYPSPTILVNGVDVMTGAAGVASAYACRLDVPTQAAVVTALGAAAPGCCAPTAPASTSAPRRRTASGPGR